jgi:regulator of cell morphogenesis and NO signaling
MRVTADRVIRDIVAADGRTAAIVQRYGLDFSCRGNRTIEAACEEAGVPVERVRCDLADATALPSAACAPRFSAWDAPAVTDYIISNHHGYVRQQLPLIRAQASKVARVHGSRHPEMVAVAEIFARLSAEMTSHMAREEKVLFPYLDRLAEASARGLAVPPAPFGTVEGPIRMMEAEHESAVEAMSQMRALTDGYRVPEDACGTWCVLLQELEAFERDLHQHVHLENNILFPKALLLQSAERG